MKSQSYRPRSARFVKSEPHWRPRDSGELPQVAIGGRSNVGKSSLLNALLGRRGLARTSSTPGRTQALNYFLVDEQFLLVDLPGHGYAKAPTAIVRRWQENTRRYLSQDRQLRGVVLLLDVRREPSAEDRALLELARSAGRRSSAVVTKVDKVGRGERGRRLRSIASTLGMEPAAVVATSAKTGEGRDAVWALIREMLPATMDEGGLGADGPGR